jgi:hypothetical protein
MNTITTATVDHCKKISSQYAEQLNLQRAQMNVAAYYHPMADALAWPDELPSGTDGSFKRYFIVLLQLRTRLMLSSTDQSGMEILEDIRNAAPNWAFCQPDRFRSEHKSTFLELREASIAEMNQFANKLNQTDG